MTDARKAEGEGCELAELAPPALSAVTLRATCMRRLWEIAGDSVRSHLEGDLYAEPAARVDRALAAPAEDAVDDDVVG